ncbi:MAG TPA: NAD(P)-dependent oxidoreductase [Burkholderiales bacterium]|nr:NAD(P)-dependent oxidoreductase [Burkholderiales bacterium]
MERIDFPVGVIGTGAMGGAVARRLLACGFETHVRDIRLEVMRELELLGAQPHESAASIGASCNAIIVLVVDAPQMESALFGSGGAAESLRSGTLVVLSSTIAPVDAESFARRLAATGALVLDAPVSGGPHRAVNGEMSMMAAGSVQAWGAGQRLLPKLSNRLFHVSERSGDGARFKLVNNMLAGINLAAGAEAFALAERLGLDARKLQEVISASSGASWVVADRLQRVLSGDDSVYAATRMLAKDLRLLQAVAEDAGFAAPLASEACERFQSLVRAGLSDADDSVLIKRAREMK